MVEFIVGVAVGAAFAPFWMMVWGYVSSLRPVRAVIDFIKGMF